MAGEAVEAHVLKVTPLSFLPYILTLSMTGEAVEAHVLKVTPLTAAIIYPLTVLIIYPLAVPKIPYYYSLRTYLPTISLPYPPTSPSLGLIACSSYQIPTPLTIPPSPAYFHLFHLPSFLPYFPFLARPLCV